jgi:hypothetical protein
LATTKASTLLTGDDERLLIASLQGNLFRVVFSGLFNCLPLSRLQREFGSTLSSLSIHVTSVVVGWILTIPQILGRLHNGKRRLRLREHITYLRKG